MIMRKSYVKKKKKMIRCREQYTVFSDDTPKMDS